MFLIKKGVLVDFNRVSNKVAVSFLVIFPCSDCVASRL